MKYEKPNIEIISYDESDIVTVSSCNGHDEMDLCILDGEE